MVYTEFCFSPVNVLKKAVPGKQEQPFLLFILIYQNLSNQSLVVTLSPPIAVEASV
jgi:hypothetical protein